MNSALSASQKQYFYREPKAKSGFAYMDGTPLDRGNAVRTYFTGGPGFRFTGALATLQDEDLLMARAAPTMLMCGEFDIMTPTATRALLPKLHQGSFVEIAGAGHMIQFDRPYEWRSAIASFIRQYEG